jgi:NADH-quinone oxidoreductase subunit A
VVAFLFLLFEVELLFLFPWALVFADTPLQVETGRLWGFTALVEMGIFIGVLLVGLAYVWKNGHLNWIVPAFGATDYSSPVPKSLYDSINDRYKTD